MRVTFYGVRGSVPAPGPTTARYGGNTSCVEVVLEDGTTLILDAGTGMRALGQTLLDSGRHEKVHLLLSHTHWDHVLGLPFFGPLWRRDSELLVYPLPTDAQERFQRTIFDDIHFPVSVNDIPAKVEFAKPSAEPWRIGSATVRRIALNHPGSSQGFRIDDASGASLVYLTDNELVRGEAGEPALDALARFSESASLLIHDSQYLDSDMPAKYGWGHSVIDDVLTLGVRAEVRGLALFHHDPNRTDDDLDAIQARSAAWLCERAPEAKLCVAIEGQTLEL
ncbi:MAG: MBL fold metallo-hydrolase [Polyangiaceae bacterium]|nr:MBL fold metallo-hydrolase [Polyangiaceae bacterium]